MKRVIHPAAFPVAALVAFGVIAGLRAPSPAPGRGSCDRGPALPRTDDRTNLDQPVRRWGVYCDPRGSHPTFVMRNVPTPSKDGRSLECSYRGGSRYAGPHCYRALKARSRVDTLTLALEFRFSQTACADPATPAVVQALEFSVSRWSGAKRSELAAQYQVVGPGSPQWRIWTGTAWTEPATPFGGCLEPERWHRLGLSGRLAGGRVRYDSLTVDGQRHDLTDAFRPVRSRSEARLTVAVQANGNAASAPYRFWVDRVRLAAEPRSR